MYMIFDNKYRFNRNSGWSHRKLRFRVEKIVKENQEKMIAISKRGCIRTLMLKKKLKHDRGRLEVQFSSILRREVYCLLKQYSYYNDDS